MISFASITEKPKFTGGIGTASFISHLLSDGDTEVYICKDSKTRESIKNYLLTHPF